MSGYDTAQEARWYERAVRPYRPRVVALVYCLNDAMLVSGPYNRFATPEELARKDAQDALWNRLAPAAGRDARRPRRRRRAGRHAPHPLPARGVVADPARLRGQPGLQPTRSSSRTRSPIARRGCASPFGARCRAAGRRGAGRSSSSRPCCSDGRAIPGGGSTPRWPRGGAPPASRCTIRSPSGAGPSARICSSSRGIRCTTGRAGNERFRAVYRGAHRGGGGAVSRRSGLRAGGGRAGPLGMWPRSLLWSWRGRQDLDQRPTSGGELPASGEGAPAPRARRAHRPRLGAPAEPPGSRRLHRSLPHPVVARPRCHGRGLRRLRSGARPARRPPQAPPHRPRLGGRPPAPCPRGARPGQALPPQRRPGPRRRRARRRRVRGDGAHRGPVARRLVRGRAGRRRDRRAQARLARGAGGVLGRRARPRSRARQGARAPGRQAVQHPARQGRSGTRGRLRPGGRTRRGVGRGDRERTPAGHRRRRGAAPR